MTVFKAAIRTAGMTAGQFYEIDDPKSERFAGLIEAGFLLPVTKKELAAAGIETAAVETAPEPVVETPSEPAASGRGSRSTT